MNRLSIVLIGLFLLAGCSGGGGEPTAPASPSSQAPSPPPATPPTAAPTQFLAATADGLWRGDTSGKGGLVFTRPKLQQDTVLSSEGHVYYHRVPPIPSADGFDLQEIWTVNADGTGDRALVNDLHTSGAVSVRGPWVVYSHSSNTGTPSSSFSEFSWRSVHVETGQQAVLSTSTLDWPQRIVGQRVVFSSDLQLTSINFDGTDARTHVDVSTSGNYLYTKAVVEPDIVIYEWFNERRYQLFSVSVSHVGVQGIPLDTSATGSAYKAQAGDRVVYHRGGDVLSVRLDGTQQIFLTDTATNEAAQGIVGDRVMIRRNASGHDQLVSVYITGGVEMFIMTLLDTDFIEVVAGDSLVLRRSTGTWRLDLDRTLTKLGSTTGGHAYQVVGNAVCYNVNAALYCAPLDGSGPEVRIDQNGKIVGVL